MIKMNVKNAQKFRARTEVLHYPRLDTVLMIENTIKNSRNYKSKTLLWKTLPKKVMYQTFKIVIDYLIESRKVILTRDNKLVWVFADTPKARKLIEESVLVA
ncbi:MAG: hypothetical protein ABH821_01020 [archaeon]